MQGSTTEGGSACCGRQYCDQHPGKLRAAGAFDIVTGDVELLGGRPAKPLRDACRGAEIAFGLKL